MKSLEQKDYPDFSGSNEKTAILFISPDYCSRCEVAKQVISKIETKVEIKTFDAVSDVYPCNELEVKTVPTLITFIDGEVVDRLERLNPDELEDKYKEAL